MSSLTSLAMQELRVGSFTVQVKERLAEGGFGFVDLVIDVHTKKELVLKRCNVDRIESMEIVKKEINILQRFAGPNMVELLASDIIQKNKQSREALLLMEYYTGGHLLDRLNMRNGVSLSQESIYRIFGQILLCVKSLHLHNPSIVHRDLKLENILFDSDGKVRLCDFGSCVEGFIHLRNIEERQAAEEIIAKETTQMYRAPELVDLYMRDVLTEKSDIWALGCILYTLCYLTHPFQNAGSLGILSAKIQFPKESIVPEDCHTLILRMLDVDPEARPDISQILSAIVALSKGKPLPPYQLSEEAEKRRRDRLAADELRQKKAAAKKGPSTAAVSAAPKAIPISSNSVAAKRLAALRGGQLPEGGGSSSSSSQLLDEFDPFGSTLPTGLISVDDFQPTFSTAPVDSTFNSSQTQAAFPAFDAFGWEGGVDAVAAAPVSVAAASYSGDDTDWLDGLPSAAAAAAAAPPQTPSSARGASANDIFDFEPSLPLPPPRKETSSERNLVKSFDLLEIVVNNHQPPQMGDSFFVASSAPSPAKSVNALSVKDSATLDLLDLDIPTASSSSSFTSAAATATKNKHDRVLSLFDVDHPTPAPPPTPTPTPTSQIIHPHSFTLSDAYFSPPGTPNTRDARPMRHFDNDYRPAMPPLRPNLPAMSPAMKLTLESAANNSYMGVGATPMRGIYPSAVAATPLRPQQPSIPMSGSRPAAGGSTLANFQFSSTSSSTTTTTTTKIDPFDNLNFFPSKM